MRKKPKNLEKIFTYTEVLEPLTSYGFDEGIHFVPKTINCGGTWDSLLRSGETSVMEIERRVRVDVQFYKISTAWQALPADPNIKLPEQNIYATK